MYLRDQVLSDLKIRERSESYYFLDIHRSDYVPQTPDISCLCTVNSTWHGLSFGSTIPEVEGTKYM